MQTADFALFSLGNLASDFGVAPAGLQQDQIVRGWSNTAFPRLVLFLNQMVFKACHWLSIEVQFFYHALKLLNIHYQSVHEYEYCRRELDDQRPQSRQFLSALTSQHLNQYADLRLLSRTLPAVSRGSSPCLTLDQLEHIKTVAQPNRLIVQTHDDTSYFLSDEIEMVDEWHVAMHSCQDLQVEHIDMRVN
jgi:hypothetical protein